jgi:hypothetical protein
MPCGGFFIKQPAAARHSAAVSEEASGAVSCIIKQGVK